MKDFGDLVVHACILLGAFVGVISIVFFLGWGLYLVEKQTCYAQGAAQGMQKTEYDFWSECTFTLPNGKKINRKNYRGI